MDEFLSKYSKGTIAFVVITLGILYIVLTDPPHDKCDRQKEVFKTHQEGGIYVNPKHVIKGSEDKTTPFERQYNVCFSSNRPGACFEYFAKLKKLMADLDTVSEECLAKVVDQKSVKQALDKSLKLMTQIGWGSAPPTRTGQFSWLDSSDIALFCQLKHMYQQKFPKKWQKQTHTILSELPGAKNLGGDDYWKQAWGKSLLSVQCKSYL